MGIHKEARDVNKENSLCTGWTGEEHPEEDDRHHQPGGFLHRPEGRREQAHPDSIARDIEKACQGIYPLHDVRIRKVKVMKRPRFDLNKLMDMHGEGSGKTVVTTDAATGEAVER